jgi:ubiquinone/menaquinone biosynthesis C-methylase UbiE
VNENLNPQAKEMADESMIRNLSAQAEAIWPQERPLFARYGLPRDARVLDAGCGTGEISFRLAELLPDAQIVGVDILDEHLERARARCTRFGERVRFEHQSLFALGLPGGTFDLAVCRHVLQAIPGSSGPR